MPFVPAITPAFINIHDRAVETPTSIFSSPSPTSGSPFGTTITSSSPTATISENSRWVFRSWDGGAIAFTVIIAVCVIVAAVVTCSSVCFEHRSGSGNARLVAEQTNANPTARQNRWYNRPKKPTSSNSSRTRRPETITVESVRTRSRSRALSHQRTGANATSQMDQPPAYTRPVTPPPVFLDPAETPTDTTLPTYETHHRDRRLSWESPNSTIGSWRAESMPAPTYVRHWNSCSIFDQTGRNDQHPGSSR